MQLHRIDVSMYDDSFLAKTLDARIAETGCETLEAYDTLLGRDGAEVDALVTALHIGYSAFFRNPLTFAVLERIILPEIIRKAREAGRREVRIWSAGCAAGQEPCSVAILLEELLEKTGRAFDYRIFATDVREAQIVLAHTGVYTPDALGNAGLQRITRWFSPQGSGYKALPKLAGRIDFSVHDLLGSRLRSPPPSIFGDFDLILCCNLLFYYSAKCRKSILEKLGHSLGREGYLVTGETERGFMIENGHHEMFPQSAVFCRKDI
jgi:chemotaxis protein methyltransferase CheR